MIVGVARVIIGVAIVIVIGGLVGGLVVVVVDGGGVVFVVETPPVVVVATVLCVDAIVVGSLVVVGTVAGGTVGVVEIVMGFPTVLKDAVTGPEPGVANAVPVDPGEVAADAPGGAPRGAEAATDVGVGPSGVARSACTGASVGACE